MGEFTLTGIKKFKVVTNTWKQTKKFLDLVEGGNGQHRLHLESRAPSWAGLWTLSYMPRSMGMAYQLENQTPAPCPPADGTAPELVPRLSIA